MGTSHIEQLRAIVQPGDAEYESARKVHNAMIDKRPALVVRAGQCWRWRDSMPADSARTSDETNNSHGGSHGNIEASRDA